MHRGGVGGRIVMWFWMNAEEQVKRGKAKRVESRIGLTDRVEFGGKGIRKREEGPLGLY